MEITIGDKVRINKAGLALSQQQYAGREGYVISNSICDIFEVKFANGEIISFFHWKLTKLGYRSLLDWINNGTNTAKTS